MFVLFLIVAISILRGANLEQMDFQRLKMIEQIQLEVAEGEGFEPSIQR